MLSEAAVAGVITVVVAGDTTEAASVVALAEAIMEVDLAVAITGITDEQHLFKFEDNEAKASVYT